MKHWIISFALFMAVFVGCLATVFNPIRQAYEITAPGFQGAGLIKKTDMVAMGKNWTEHPNYFVTVGITAFIALGGAFYSIYRMSKIHDEKDT